jgi:molecular chaperone GrpE
MSESEDSPKRPEGRQAADQPLDPTARIRELESSLEAARQEARQNHERWMRERADLENVKKRSARERTETVNFANERLVRDLLPIVDNLERAVEHASGGGNGAPLVEGVTLVLKSLVETLERHGLTRIHARGAPFDPAHHEAMAQVETAEHAPNSVVEEHQRGYRLNERLLRPALVTIAKAPSGDDLAKGKDRG